MKPILPQFQAASLQEKALQKQFPGNYARLANPIPLSQALPDTFRAFKTLGQTGAYNTASDYDLANLDDTLKRGGSLLIASLATLGMRNRIFGVGEFLGFASWFGAMAVTPLIINTLVRLKTGVNLNQQYDSTYGQRQNMFKDPNYLPLQILSDETINRIAEKTGIPASAPNRRQLTEEKIRQISVQANTWWMLMAGPATPVISGLVCDQLQGPATRLVNVVKLFVAEQAATNSQQDAQKLGKQTERFLNQLVGARAESDLTRWWQRLSPGISNQSGLTKAFKVADAVDLPMEARLQKLANYFAKLNANDPVIDQTLRYLEKERNVLSSMEKKATDFLKQYEHKLAPEVFREQSRLIETRLGNAFSTLTHYQALFNKLRQGSATTQELRLLLEKPTLPEVQRLIVTGFETEARKLVGSAERFKAVRSALSIRQYERAAALMGAAPGEHLLVALKDTLLRKLWQKRMILGLGGSLLLATVLFNQLFIGRNFHRKGVSQA